jgi:hypothetical protein
MHSVSILAPICWSFDHPTLVCICLISIEALLPWVHTIFYQPLHHVYCRSSDGMTHDCTLDCLWECISLSLVPNLIQHEALFYAHHATANMAQNIEVRCLNSRLGGRFLWSLACSFGRLVVCPSIRPSVSDTLVFISCIHLWGPWTLKMTDPDFSGKFSFGLNWAKKTQNDSIMDIFNTAKSGHFLQRN